MRTLAMRVLAGWVFGTVVAGLPCAAQTPVSPKLSFDVVSIKPNKSASDNVRVGLHGDTLTAMNIPTIELVSEAYNIKPNLISGAPGWLNESRFDLEAKMSPEDAAEFNKLSRDESLATSKGMLRALLAKYFNLKAHVETRQLPLYELVIAKGGLKVKEAAPDDPYANGIKRLDGKPAGAGSMIQQNGSLTVQGIEMAQLANNLASQLQRTVIDKTGLKGKYDFTLQFTPDNRPAGADNGTSQDLPPLFIALEEQLGLKLLPSKGPVDTLVIDHIEQPTQN